MPLSMGFQIKFMDGVTRDFHHHRHGSIYNLAKNIVLEPIKRA
jgi:hypothetical protein